MDFYLNVFTIHLCEETFLLFFYIVTVTSKYSTHMILTLHESVLTHIDFHYQHLKAEMRSQYWLLQSNKHLRRLTSPY
jgi:hypothetical protein